ncbi:related to mitochondrial uncoupling protein 3 [Moesziomyces antarcticus]|uniref:Related to mitochondrial uncoupling protein 3 n=2 Tax=Pseudozyma antarctica TaxID=84753 RepID=A0A5C3FEX3_PSEA2|nr:related to mitochondrial uncoupling protein 3 [Moesziomyces antarcticus]
MSRSTPSSALSRDQAIASAEHPQHNPPLHVAHSPTYTLAATFASAGLGNAISAACTNPADIVKVRQQLDTSRSGFLAVARGMVRREGVLALWNGVTASCLRELTYSTVRFGLYETFKDGYSSALGVSDSSFALKALSGVSSGAIGSAFACPTDLVKVRMQAIRPTGRPPYSNTFVAFSHVYREGTGFVGGIKSLYRGVGPTIVRAAVLTSSQIASYDQVKTVLKRNNVLDEGFALHFSASMVAGLACSVTSAPFDTVKVRLMQDKKREFKNAFDCLAKLVANEGPLALYKGFAMCWARLGSHTVISLILFERFRTLFGVKPL